MQFRSERDQQLSIKVISQMIVLIETLIQRMVPVHSAADLSATHSGRLLLDAVCMQYLAHQYFNIDPRQVLWITRHSLPSLRDSLKTILATLISSGSASMNCQHDTQCQLSRSEAGWDIRIEATLCSRLLYLDVIRHFSH
jgi:hypothetical protein